MTKQTITYTVKFKPETGDARPWEVWVTSEAFGHKHLTSCKTLSGAEKSRKSYIKGREEFFNILSPEYAA